MIQVQDDHWNLGHTAVIATECEVYCYALLWIEEEMAYIRLIGMFWTESYKYARFVNGCRSWNFPWRSCRDNRVQSCDAKAELWDSHRQ